MKKYFSLLLISTIGLGANAQSDAAAHPFPATCLLVENEISPNESGEIVFLPEQKCLIEAYNLMVFDADGELIFETTDSEEAWKVSPDAEKGVYTWKITGKIQTISVGLESSGTVSVAP